MEGDQRRSKVSYFGPCIPARLSYSAFPKVLIIIKLTNEHTHYICTILGDCSVTWGYNSMPLLQFEYHICLYCHLNNNLM
jgi:hypothetical protein